MKSLRKHTKVKMCFATTTKLDFDQVSSYKCLAVHYVSVKHWAPIWHFHIKDSLVALFNSSVKQKVMLTACYGPILHVANTVHWSMSMTNLSKDILKNKKLYQSLTIC